MVYVANTTNNPGSVFTPAGESVRYLCDMMVYCVEHRSGQRWIYACVAVVLSETRVLVVKVMVYFIAVVC